MKKLYVSMAIIVGILIGNVAIAGVSNTCLSIALNNSSAVSVQFATAVDPGYIPTVKPGEKYTLPGDFMESCLSNTCDIIITPTTGSEYTVINSVPKGTRITYVNPGKYTLNPHAGVRCPS